MNEPPGGLIGILETVVYCDSTNEERVVAFYRDVLKLKEIGEGWAYRIGPNLLLIFNVEESSTQTDPPPHGARGPGHTCFVTEADRYAEWKTYISGLGVPITREKRWPTGVNSFYFEDPAGNVLEIADGDLWPK